MPRLLQLNATFVVAALHVSSPVFVNAGVFNLPHPTPNINPIANGIITKTPAHLM